MAYRKTQLGRGYNSQAAGSRHEEVNLRLSNLAKLPAGQLWRTIAPAYMFTKFVFHVKFEGHTIHNCKTNTGRTDRCELRLRGKAGGWAEFWQGRHLKVHRAVRFAADASAEQETWRRSIVHHSECSMDLHRLFLKTMTRVFGQPLTRFGKPQEHSASSPIPVRFRASPPRHNAMPLWVSLVECPVARLALRPCSHLQMMAHQRYNCCCYPLHAYQQLAPPATFIKSQKTL